MHRRWDHAVAWWRGRVGLTDAVVMVVAVAPTVVVAALHLWDHRDLDGRAPDVWFWMLAACVVVPLAWRRSRPAVATTVGLSAYLVMMLAGYADLGLFLPAVILAHTLGNHVAEAPRAHIVRVLAIGGVIMVVVRIVGVGLDGAALFVVAAFFRGQSVRNHRAYLAELLHRVETADALAADEARLAMAAERSSIARDLHDVVAHGMSVMVVQAGAARRVLNTDPDAARQALMNIEATGRSSLAEMRMLLGVLRDEPEQAGDGDGAESGAPVMPQPGVGDLDALVASVRDAGRDITLHIDPAVMELPEVMGVTVYRIVQEAVTNTLKHAGPANVTVQVTVTDGRVHTRVSDDGRGAAVLDDGSGHGLIGMAERVGMFHGELSAGPGLGGGFEVVATWPITVDHRIESRR